MDQMPNSHHWMVPDHSRTRIPHNFLDFLAHLWFVAMHGAVLASGFFKAEGTFFQALFCI